MNIAANNADSIPDFMVWGTLILVPLLFVALLFGIVLGIRYISRFTVFNRQKEKGE